jgi:LPS sulfotransferase NodH
MDISRKIRASRQIRTPGWMISEKALQGYVLCGEPRSGTTFLKEVLASTNKMGNPVEWFHPRYREELQRADDPLGMMLARTASPNGVYGLKVFSGHAAAAAAAGWISRLPNLSFVHVRRHDLLDQAISLVRAMQTSRFSSSEIESKQGSYDRAQIATMLKRLARGQARWDIWFASHGIQPLRICYDDIMVEPQSVVTRIAGLVGVADAAIDWSKVSAQVMRDGTSAEWKRRYLAEAGPADRVPELEESSFAGMAKSLARALRQRAVLSDRFRPS